MRKLDQFNEIAIVPGKPKPESPAFMDMLKGSIEIELKVDGTRCILFKDPDDGYYKPTSSSGKLLRGNYLNIIKQLKPSLDQGWIWVGEIIDSENPDDRGASLSVAQSASHKPEKMLYIVWNVFKITDEMKQAGQVTPDVGSGLPPYKEMRINLINWLRKLKPTQVKAIKRFRMNPMKDKKPSEIIDMIMSMGMEGVVAKSHKGKIMWKYKGKFPVQIYPLVNVAMSTATSRAGLIQSLDVVSPWGKVMTVGQGYSIDSLNKLTGILQGKTGGNLDGLYVGFVGTKPTKPLDQGGSWTNPVFLFLASDADGKNRLVDAVPKSEIVSEEYEDCFEDLLRGTKYVSIMEDI